MKIIKDDKLLINSPFNVMDTEEPVFSQEKTTKNDIQ